MRVTAEDGTDGSLAEGNPIQVFDNLAYASPSLR